MAPYTIYHIHLEVQVDIFDNIKEECPYYLVIWWQQIPLGYLYIEPDEMLDRNELQLKIIRAIQPCIDHYQSISEFPEKNYISAYLNNNVQEFASIMKEIFLPYEIYDAPQKIELSIIICTHNRSNDLLRCLQSLHNQKYFPFEVIVVDNAPDDHSTKAVVDRFPEVIYYKEERKGLSIARNAGIQLASSSIIAFIDDDTTIHPLWCLRIWETFRSPEVKAMTGLILPASLETESQQLFEKHWGFTKNFCDKEFDYSFIENHLKKAPSVWLIGAGANMAFRKSVFETIGLFDERLGAGAAGCSEDSELWFRMLVTGNKIHYNPRAVVYHTHRKEVNELQKQLYFYARGHMTAALIQEQTLKDTGYRKRVFIEYPKTYLRRLLKGFPLYRYKNKTLFQEIRGWFEGIRYFKKECKKPMIKHIAHQKIVTTSVNSSKAI